MIGYLGPEGSDSYFAATSIYPRDELIPHKNLGRLFYALESHEVEKVIVPYENMKEGMSFDVLGRVRKGHYHISDEIVLEIVYNLISKEMFPNGIEEVYATVHARNECYNTLKTELGKYQKMEVKSEAIAIDKLAVNSNFKSAALVSSLQELGSYNVVLSDLRDTKENTHRFAVVTRTLEVNGLHNRTLIACSPKFNRKGSLYDILHEFVIRDINITKILSSPQKTIQDDIIIYIEMEGNIEDKIISESLSIVTVKSRFISILGSYYCR